MLRCVRALLIENPGRMRLTDVPEPARPDECLIDVTMAGVCGTDLELLEGYADFRGVPGHEFVGRVRSAGSEANRSWIGKRVVGEINVGCGTCGWCRRNEREHCIARTVVGIRERDGAFADCLALPTVNLHEVPDSVDDRAAVFVEPIAAACRILDQIELRNQTRVAVLGDGRLAQLVAQVLRTRAGDVVLMGRHDRKLEIARALGIAARRRSHADQHAFDVVVEATGSGAALAEAVELARPRGTVVMKSTVHADVQLATWPIVVNEVTLIGSRCGPFRPAIALLASGAVRVEPLIDGVHTLEEYERAFEEARRGLKILFDLERRS
jgi:threonine dehydrogenase-like Zn-dependent dehydrogenase